MSACLICLLPGADDHGYHPVCLEGLLGQPTPPRVEDDLPQLRARLVDLAGGLSLSGVQPKALAQIEDGRLLLVERGGRYVLKPPTEEYAELPENEHLTMVLAQMAGIRCPPCGLLRLRDERLAYLIRRFDRIGEGPGQRLQQVDFAALSGLPRLAKYEGSAEGCADLLRRHSAEPEVDLRRLYQLFVFSYWVGNGDLHLKNLSLLERPEHPGTYVLSPAYDLVCTLVPLPKDRLALPVHGRVQDVKRADFVALGAACGLQTTDAEQVIDDLLGRAAAAAERVERSFLSDSRKATYQRVLRKRSRVLGR